MSICKCILHFFLKIFEELVFLEHKFEVRLPVGEADLTIS